MQHAIEFLIRHGGPVLFVAILLDELGFPMPAVPFLLAAGAIVAKSQLHPLVAYSVALLACFIADSAWFFLGRHGGNRVLRLLCRISIEPDSCVRRTRNIFDRWGMRAVLVAKFMPGLSAIVPPMAGGSGVSFARFLAFDFAGSSLYIVSYLVIGAIFSNQLEQVLDAITGLGKSAVVFLAALLAIYLVLKYIRRNQLLRELRLARITVDELHKKLEDGETVSILDLRARSELEEDPTVITGAFHMTVDEIENGKLDLPPDRDLVVYCSCPNEVTSARVAQMLRRKGFTRVRPLLGGIAAWRERNYPTVQQPVAMPSI
jgi:membrane protein DedA with SNARE-associated domain/rhodanese-related sulfurtransferase